MTPELCLGGVTGAFYYLPHVFHVTHSLYNEHATFKSETNKQNPVLQREGKKGSVWVPPPVAGGDTPVRSVPKASLSLIQVSATAPQD